MPISGDGNAGLAILMRKLATLPDYKTAFIAQAIPTVQKLLNHAEGTIEPAGQPAAGRRYDTHKNTIGHDSLIGSSFLQDRINANTIVSVDNGTIRVDTGEDNPHLRPLVPIGALPLKWRGAIAAKVNGAIRRHLKAQGLLPPPVKRGPRKKKEPAGE